VLLGTVSQSLFALAYARCAKVMNWPACVAAATLVFALLTPGLRMLAFGAVPAFALAIACDAAALRLMPKATAPRSEADIAPLRFDLPLRMLVATGIVLSLTEVASTLGPHLTGLLSPFPVFATILAVFAHRQGGAEAGIDVMRGLLTGLFAFSAFFVIAALTLPRTGIGVSLVLSLGATLAVQALALQAILRPGRRSLL